MDQKSLDLPNLNFQASEVAYDPASKSLLLANGSNFINYDLSSQNIISESNWGLPKLSGAASTQEKASKPQNDLSLRFVSVIPQAKIAISLSGLLATAQTAEETMIATNIGFSSGVHYWEIICPKRCKNIHIGIMKEAWKRNMCDELLRILAFKTSTPRVVGIRLDLDKGELKCWLNGIPQNHKTIKNIETTTWYPCVRFKENGSHAILNPFAVDPESSSAVYEPETKIPVSQIKLALSHYAVFVGFQQLHKNPVKFDELFTMESVKGKFQPEDSFIDETGTIVAFRFKNAVEAENFTEANLEKKHNEKPLYFLDGSTLSASALEYQKNGGELGALFSGEENSQLYIKALNWIQRNLGKLCQLYETSSEETGTPVDRLVEEVLGKVSGAKGTASHHSENALQEFSLQYVQKSDTLLVSQGNQLKLLNKENGKFQPKTSIFVNKPQNPKDEIVLTLSRSDIAMLLNHTNLKTNASKIFNNKSSLTSLKEFLAALNKATEKGTNETDVHIQYKHAKIVVNNLLSALFASLKWMKSLVQEAADILDNQKPSAEDKSTNLQQKIAQARDASLLKTLNINQIYYMLHILLNIDETLYAMTLHDQSSKKLKNYWPSKTPRLFTAFARLGSLLTHPSNKFSLVQIAEAGLYNTQDILYDIKHFLDPKKRLEEIHNLRNEEDLWSFLHKSLLDNRMVQNLPCENVPLHVTLNNIPAQQHSTDANQKIINIGSNQATSFVSTVSENGDVKIWNTELALVDMATSNYKKKLTSKKAKLLREEDEGDNIIVGMEIGAPVEEEEELVPPNEELLETLIAMGFPAHLASKALSLTNNVNMDSAIDKIDVLREEEEKALSKPAPVVQPQPKAKTQVKYNLTKIKPTWTCAACTFVNTNSVKICDICGCQAPVTAYFTEDELNIKEAPEPVEEEKPKEVVQAEVNQKDFLETAKVKQTFIVPLLNSPFSPVVAGVVFEEDAAEPQKYKLRLRRFAYSSSYIKRFIQKDKNKGHYSLISGTWFNKNVKASQDYLANDFGLTFRALEPIYIGNLRYEDSKDTKESFFAGDFVCFDEVDFNIDAAPGRLAGLTVLSNAQDKEKDTAYIYLVWNNNSKYTLQQLVLQSNGNEPAGDKPSYEVKSAFTQGLDLTGKLLSVDATHDSLVISSDKQVLVFGALKLEAPSQVLPVASAATQARLLGSDAVAFFKAGSNPELVRLTQASQEDSKKSGSESSTTLKVPEAASLTESDIDSVAGSLHQKLLKGFSHQRGVIHPSFSDSNNKHSKFFLPLCGESESLEIALEGPTFLTNLDVSIYFDLQTQHLQAPEQRKDFLSALTRRVPGAQQTVAHQASPKKEEQGGEIELPALNMTEGDAGKKFLGLTVNNYKGSCYNEKFQVSQLLSFNNEVFRTNYPNSEFIFEHLQEKFMLVKSVTVQSKQKPAGKDSYPIGSGLIFISDYLAHLDMTHAFHKMSHEEFQEWFRLRSESKEELQPWEPVGSFQFEESSESVTVDLVVTRPCKYIMMKPTSMRKTPEDYSQRFEIDPVEIKFFGAIGAVLSQEIPTARKVANAEGHIVAQGTEVAIEGKNEAGQWVHIHTLKDIPIQTIVDTQKTPLLQRNWEAISELPLWGSSTQSIANEALFQARFTALRVKALKVGSTVPASWIMTGFSIEGSVSNESDLKQTAIMSPSALRNLLLNPREFEKLNAGLIRELSKPTSSHTKRSKIALLISNVLSLEPSLVKLFYQHLDIKSFLQYSIIEERNSTFLEIQNFLQCFSTQKAFAQNLFDALVNLLPSLSKTDSISHAGLNGIFSLLAWCQSLNPTKVFNVLLNELHSLSKKITDIRAPEYNILRTHYKVSGLVLEEDLFSETNIPSKQTKRKTKEDIVSEKRKEKTPLKSTFLAHYSNDVDEYLIDLGQNCRVQEVRLAFDHSTRALKFRVQIWAVDNSSSGSKKLIHSKFYNESTWIQLTNYAYDRNSVDNHYKPTEELECLGFSNINVNSRYLIVQVTYALLPFVQPPSDKTDKKVIPEVYGESITNETGEIAELQNLFNIKNPVHKDNVSHSHSVKYDKSEIPGKALPYKYVYAPADTTNKAAAGEGEAVAVVQDSEEALSGQLKALQTDLSKQLEIFKDTNGMVNNQDEVTKLCEEIEEVQTRILTARGSKAHNPKTPLSSSLDYLYLLASKYSQALCKLDAATPKEKREWRNDEKLQGEEGRKITYELFEKLIVFENGPISKQFITLLSEVLVKNLKDVEWHRFTISVLDNLLSNPIDPSTSRIDSIYSHAHVVEALNQISVPTSEILSYLITKCGISIEGPSASQKKNKDNSSLICSLTSVLLLLNKQYAKSPSAQEAESPTKKSALKLTDRESGQESGKPTKESIRAAYYICIWICENLPLEGEDIANILILGLDIVSQTIKSAKATELNELLKDANSFLKLFMSIIKINSSELLSKFQAVLNIILDPTSTAKEAPSEKEDDSIAEETKLLLTQHFQTSLRWLVNYTSTSEQSHSSSDISYEDLSVDAWLSNVCFVLEFLLLAGDKMKAVPAVAQKESKPKAYERKRSQLGGDQQEGLGASITSVDQPQSETKLEETEKPELVHLDLIGHLSLLLSPKAVGKTGYNLSTSSRAWTLVMKLISRVKAVTLVESKVFSNLIKSFLCVTEDIQHMLFQQIIDLTQKIIKHEAYHKELCNAIIHITFESLEYLNTSSHHYIGFSLIKGWLDMLLTGASPKPENLQNKPIAKAFCKLNAQGALTLLTNLSNYFWNYLNLGGKQGAQGCSNINLIRLQVGDELLKLLVSAESSTNTSAARELFSSYNKHSKEIQSSIQRFIQWYLLNKTTDSAQSPSTDLMKSLSDTLLHLFEIIEEHEDVAKLSLAALVSASKEIDATLNKLQASHQISGYVRFNYSSRTCVVIEELFNLWVTNDSIASYVALEVKGFEYLLDRMSFTDQTSTTTKTSAFNSLKGTDLFNYISRSKEAPKIDLQARQRPEGAAGTGSIEDPKEEEVASKVTIINQSGQTWANIPPDWSVNKKGNKARILFFVMNGQFYHEYPLLLKLDKPVELNQIKIGFNTVWTEHTDKVLGVPTSVSIEGGSSEADLTYLGTLEPMSDKGYSEFSVKVFEKNFQTIADSKNIETSLASLVQKKVHYLKFKFTRPVVNFVEDLSLLANKTYKTAAVSISFLSVTGIDAKKLNDINKKITETQEKSALQVVSKLCNQQFVETLKVIANESSIVSKIKSSFETLAGLLIPHESWLTPIFLAIASYNTQMGDWIISKFLDLNRSREHARIVGEIALSKDDSIFGRTAQIHTFILAELKKVLLLSKAESMNKFNRLVPFIEVFCAIVRSLPTEFIQNNTGKSYSLPFTAEDLETIIQSFEQYNASTHSKNLIKLLLLYLYIPAPFALQDESLAKVALERLWTLVSVDKKTLFYEMLGPLIIGSNFSAKWFLNHIETVLADVLSKVENLTSASFKTLRYSFTLLNNISRNDLIKKKLFSNQWHLKLYEGLKNKDPKAKTILKEIDTDILQLVVDFLKNVSLGYPQAEEDLAKVLIKDNDLLDTKRDLFFVNNLLVPLLNAETEIPVCLYPFNSQTGRIVTDLKRLPVATPTTTPQTTQAFKSKLLNETQSEKLLKVIQDIGTTKKSKNASWELGLTNSVDGENLLYGIKDKLSKKGPFLIILEGTNQGKKCQVGVFSSQSIPELPDSFETQSDLVYSIPNADDNFIFYYCDQVSLHFPIPANTTQKEFGTLQVFYDGGGGLCFSYNGLEKVFISFSQYQPTFAEFFLQEMKPMDSDNKQGLPDELVKDFLFTSAEYWVLKQEDKAGAEKQVSKNVKTGDNLLSSTFLSAWHNPTYPLNYYRASPVYNVPSSLTAEKLAELAFNNSDMTLTMRTTQEKLEAKALLTDLYEFVINKPETNGIIDLEFDAYQYVEKKHSKKTTAEGKEGEELKYKPALTFFETFEKNEGVKKLIEVGLRSLGNWKNKPESKKWRTWLQELSSFGALPNFFGLFLKNKDCMQLLFKILTGGLDKRVDDEESSPEKKVDEEEQKAVKYSYQILAEVFGVDNGPALRELAIEQQFFTRILDRIGMISKETKRKWYDDYQKKEQEEAEKSSPERKVEEDTDDYKQKSGKKKGIGYASDNTGQNQKWNVSEYVESKKSKNDQLQATIEILTNFLEVKDWHPPKKVLNEICESSLLPLLEAAFRSASLLDMAKEASLNQAFLKLTKTISNHKALLPCLLDLDRHYQPAQKDSIYTLLSHLKDLAQIFLNCLTAADKESISENQKLAQDIMDAFNFIKESVQSSQEFEEGNEAEMMDIMSQPLAQAYRSLLQNLRFDYVNMKDASSKFNHHYASYINDTTPSQQKMVRLAQELADLSTALPIEHTNSIFVRVDESRVDVMKAVIMGAAGTPYGHGAFEYDIFFDDSYPNAPPKVNLTTTGTGKVRFNPNLYHCGKVCLSLLGTWRGNASENWDPKLSTLLQVLVSIQAIIMSEEIYFNEPGYEGEAGTDEGDKKNEAYCNIVRYCNIKYAMVDQIRNPPKGFETVVRRHFYLKKNEIMEEARKWLKYAEHRNASYSGLVADHNSSWCTQFKASKTKYKEMLADAIRELEAELNKLQPPTGKDVKQKVIKKKENKAKQVNIESGVANLEDIDMSYEKNQNVEHKEMDIQDDSVKDRWSRYIGAMGLDAVTKQANASIFLSGLGALGLEIAKNIVLSGVKKLTIHDIAQASYRDLSGQFFLGEEDIGKNRAEASLNKIQQLNYYVKVDTVQLGQKLPKDEAELEKLLKGYTLVILTENDYETQIAIDNYCRKHNIYFITSDLYGPFARTFSDFGKEFVVVDKNGEELQEVMIGNITNEEKGLVQLLAGHTHKFEDGDSVVIHGVEGMELTNKEDVVQGHPTSINQTQHKVQVVTASSFRIGDTSGYTEYVRNGLAKPIKTPVSISFKTLSESLTDQIPFDSNMVTHDFLKMSHPQILHIAFQALDTFTKTNNRLPKSWNVADSDAFIKIAHEVAKGVKDYQATEDKKFEVVLRMFSFTAQGVFSPLAAFMGGYIAQEAIKAITQKFMPTKQFFYTDCYEVIPELPENAEELEAAIKNIGVEEKKHRSDGLRICVGDALLNEMKYANLFMVGAGAIGCELLKNFAMLGVGTGEAGKENRKEGGKIVLTDPDVIEVSNLNRQFLFREKHLRKPKSQTAAAAAIQMNKDLKGHIVARLDKVHEGTANIFTDKFFEELSIVANALDNVQARRYIDLRCVNSKVPLLESGTLGPKGHVQVILPYKTESYSSQQDPAEDAEIPHCTLKMFPEETLHCVEWARDKFGKIFTQKPKALMKLVEDPNLQVTDSNEIKTLRDAVTLLQKRPSTFDDCIRYARLKFQKYFVNDIRQLLYTYPLDFKTKEGRPFWSLPKRPPTEITFDPTNLLHASAITAMACLRANIFDIPIPKDARKDSGKLKIAEEAAQVKVPDFKPSDEKAKEINSEVKKDEGGDKNTENEEADDDAEENEVEELITKFKKFTSELPQEKGGKLKCCKPEEFEKDNDQNFHIDFIYALANSRSSNYKLEPMDWMTVKLKAGRIVPALATTTASVAGLQTIELCKIFKKSKVEDMKNAFLSLAVPILALSEPGPAPKTKLSEKLTVNIWDRWDVKLPRNATLKDLYKKLEETYELVPKDVSCGSQTIYFHALMDIKGKEKEKEEKLNSKLEDLIGLEKEDKYADLSVMFSQTKESEILKGVPFVRVILEN